MKALVTGGSGFLGRHLVERLLLEGDEVRVLARRPAALGHLASAGARIVPGDVRQWPSLRRAVDGVDVIYHCAGKVEASGRWVDFLEANVLGTERLIQAALEHSVGRLVHMSSIGGYGEGPLGIVNREVECSCKTTRRSG